MVWCAICLVIILFDFQWNSAWWLYFYFECLRSLWRRLFQINLLHLRFPEILICIFCGSPNHVLCVAYSSVHFISFSHHHCFLCPEIAILRCWGGKRNLLMSEFCCVMACEKRGQRPVKLLRCMVIRLLTIRHQPHLSLMYVGLLGKVSFFSHGVTYGDDEECWTRCIPCISVLLGCGKNIEAE